MPPKEMFDYIQLGFRTGLTGKRPTIRWIDLEEWKEFGEENIRKSLEGARVVAVECIFTFSATQQEFACFRCPNDIPEERFLRSIVQWLCKTYSPTMTKRLVKISCCQLYTASARNMLPFIRRTNGKFYFNPGTNRDSEIAKLAALRDAVVARYAASSKRKLVQKRASAKRGSSKQCT
jgi:hypothetical protein